jgi:hypothetical protein
VLVLNKGLTGKISLIFIIFLTIITILIFIFPAFAALESGNVTLVNPANNTYQKGTITLNATSTTDIINASFYYSNNSTTFLYSIGANASCGGTICTFSWNTASGVVDGSYNVTANVTNTTDWSYNITVTNYNVTIDNTAPASFTNVSPTLVNNTNSTQTFLYVNFTLTETNLDVCLLQLGNASNFLQNLSMSKGGSGSSGFCYLNNTGQPEYNINYTVFANDSAGNQAKSGTYFTRLDRTSPALNTPTPSNNSYIQGTSAQTFSIVVSESGSGVINGTVYYKKSADVDYTSQVLDSCSGTNPTCTFDLGLSNTGTYPDGTIVQYYFKVYDYAENSGNNGTASEPLQTTIDRNPPTYSGATTSPSSGVTYSSGASYQFNISWTDARSNISDVIFEFNGQNYSSLAGTVSNASSVYYKNLTDLAANESGYSYKWYANDSANRWNATSAGTYVINNASIPVTLTINNSSTYVNQNVTITYGTQINATGSSTAGTAALYRDGSSVTGANETVTLAAKTAGYAYKVNATGNANYSDNSTGLTYYLIINNATLGGSISGSSVIYSSAVNIGPSESNTGDADVNYTLWRNVTLVNSSIGSAPTNDTSSLAAATYVYVLNSSGGANYSSSSSIATLTINISQASNPTNLYINGDNNQSVSITYPTQSNITGTCGAAPNCNIYINGTQSNSENKTLITRAAGLYMIKVNTSDNANYSSYSQSYNLTVNAASTTMTLYVNGSTLTPIKEERHTSSIMNLTASVNVSDKLVSIYRNDSLLSTGYTPHENDTTLNLSIGNYTYVANWSGDANYTTSSTTVYVYINDTTAPTIDYADPTPANNTNQTSTSVTFNVTHSDQYPSKLILYLNETPNTTQSYSGSFTNITLTNLYGVYTYYVLVNDTNGNTNRTSLQLIKVDNVAPSLTSPTPSSNSYIQGTSSQTFSIVASDSVSQVKNGTVNYKKSSDVDYTSQALDSCSGTNTTCTFDLSLSNTGTYPDGTIVQYYFKVYDYAGNLGNNGTASQPLLTTIDRNPPTYANNATNTTAVKVGDPILIYVQWSDNHALSYAWLATNETSAWQNKTANYSSPANLSGLSYWSNFTWQNASVSAGTVVQWKIYANDSAGNENVTATGSFTIDGSAPTYTSNVTLANNTQYAPSRNYGFEINWTDNIAVSDVVFQWGTTNYTYLGSGGVNKSGNDIYYYNLTNLAAGTYYYKWYANDTSNNWNNSFSNITYVVNLNQSNPVDIYIVNSTETYKNQNVTITYGTSVIANATRVYPSSGEDALYRDGSNVSGAAENVTLAAKTAGYAYLANVTGNANYTSNTSGVTYYLIVNNATLQGSISGSGVNYSAAVNIGPAETNTGDADVNYTFWRNNTLVNSSIGSAPTNDTSSLAAATYVYVLNSSGGANYSSSSSIATLTINISQASNPTNLYINGDNNQSVSITYPTQSNITGTCGAAPNCNIYINGTQSNSENKTLITRAAGLYMIKVNTSDNANYSSYSQSYNLTVNNASSPIYITANESSTIIYEKSINVTAYNCPAQITCNLYRNDTGSIGSGADNVLLGVGAYTYTYNTTGGENYSSNSTTFNLVVNTKNANVTVYPQTTTITYNTSTSVNQYCLGDSSLYNCSIWRNNIAVANGTFITLAAGTYSFVANITDNSNYTNYQGTETLTVNNATLGGSLSGSNVTYPYAVNIGPAETNTGDADVNYTFWRNNTLVNSSIGSAPSNDTSVLAVATYVYVLNSSGGANYSSSSSIATLTINVSINTSTSNYMNLTLGTGTSGTETNLTVMYPNTTNATGWYNSGAFVGTAPSFALYRNGGAVGSNTDSIELGAGTYVYVYNTSDNTNYTFASKTFTLNVSKNSSNPVDLYLNNGTENKNQNVTITYGTQINATALTTYSGRGSASLYRNNSNVTETENGTAITLAASTYVYVANTSGNANYSENATGSTYYAIVNKGPTSAILYLNGSTSEQTSIYPNSTINATAVSNVTELYVQLWRNGTLINNATNTTFNITQWGAYNNNFTTKILGNENYSDSSVVTLWWNVSKANSPLVLLNNTSWTVIYPTSTNITGSGCPSAQITCSLYRNDTGSIGSGADNVLLGVGAYTYTYNTTGGENYSSNSTSNVLTISKGTPSLTLSADVWTLTDAQPITVSCSATSQNNEVTANLYRNGTDVNSTGNNENGFAWTRSAGAYNFTCNSSVTANYSSNSTSQMMTVTGTKGSIDGYITDSPGGSGIQGATVYVSGYTPSSTTSSGYYLISNVNPGAYTVYVDKTNYTSNSASATVTKGQTTQKNMTMTSTVTSDTTPPANPASVNVTQVGSTRQINVSWTASTSSDTVRYNVYYKLSGTVTTSDNSIQVGNVTKTSVTVGSDGNWNFTVTAIDSSNNENTTIITSANVTVTTTDSTPPLQPTSLAAVQVGSTKQVNITWTASTSSDVTGYYVYRSTGAVTTSSTNLGEVGNTTQFTDIVPADGTWNYTVVAHDVVPNVNTTITANATVTITTNDSTAPGVPTSLAAVQASSQKRVNLTWTAPVDSDVWGYRVYRSTGAVSTSSEVIATVQGVTRYTDEVSADGTYNYTVVAIDTSWNVGNAATSANVTVTIADSTAPNSPSTVTVTQVGSTRQINVSWTASTSSDTVAYNVYYKLSGAVTTSDNSFRVGNVTKTSWVVGSDGNWNFTVTAIDSSNNEGSIASSNNITIDTTVPGVSSTSPNGTVTNNTPTLIVNITESGYCKFDTADKTMSSMTYTMTGSGTGHQYTLSTLSDGVYTYYVRCNDTAGNEIVATSISFNLDTRSLFNITKPDTIFSYWTANQWHSFALPLWTIQTTTLTYYNVTSVLASVNGNYSNFYVDIGNNGTWRSYVPGGAINSFANFTYNSSAEIYYIYTNATDRLEIN